MLSNAICKRCINRHEMAGWLELDEARWRGEFSRYSNDGPHVLCPSEFGSTAHALSDGIPSGCPYAAEQLVNQ